MTDLITEIKQKRDEYNRQAISTRNKRDRLNEQIRGIIGKRDGYNKEVRHFISIAKSHMVSRDAFNAKVREAKKKRDQLHEEISGLQYEIDSLKRTNAPSSGPPLSALRRDLRDLEYKMMTMALTPKKEKDMMAQLKQKKLQIVEREKLVETEEILQKTERFDALKAEAREHHDVVQENAEMAQKEHELMIANFDNSSDVKKLADAQQKEMMAIKELADTQHRFCVDFTRKVHDFDKIVTGLIQKRRLESRSQQEMSSKMEAKDIFQKFKKGEKLSTDDLMSLQKAGLI